jgi:hypothetical protein
MSAPRAAAQLLRMAVSLEYFIPPATTRAGTAQRAIPTIARHIPLSPASLIIFFRDLQTKNHRAATGRAPRSPRLRDSQLRRKDQGPVLRSSNIEVAVVGSVTAEGGRWGQRPSHESLPITARLPGLSRPKEWPCGVTPRRPADSACFSGARDRCQPSWG